MSEIAEAFNTAARNDFFLVYYSGDGMLDRGRLYLATADTRDAALFATAIQTRDLRELMEHSLCDQVLLLLDCSHSGSVEAGFR